MVTHEYATDLEWSGSTEDYRRYDRTHRVTANGVDLTLSADRAFRGSADLWNPELLLVAAASSCQLLSFLAVASRAGIEVTSYQDRATGAMPSRPEPVRMSEIVLRPRVHASNGTVEEVERLLEVAHEECYIANSLACPVRVEPTVEVG